MFIVDDYAPKTAEEAFFHKDIIQKLLILSRDESIPHLLFYGPSGAGKRTIIRIFLEMLYDKTVHDIVDSTYKVSGSGNTVTEVVIKQSNYHIIIEPNNNNFDRYLIQEVVREYAKRMPMNIFTTKKVFKTVLINNVDNLSYYAQTALRRTMEKYSDTCRFIVWSESLSKVIDPLISRCYSIRIPLPSDRELFQWLYKVSVMENINNISLDMFTYILDSVQGNIREGLWRLQLIKNEKNSDSFIFDNMYKESIEDIVNIILYCKIDSVIDIREYLYDIMITNINETKILKDILDKLLTNKHISIDCKYKIIEEASFYEFNLIRKRREIIHLEGFIQKVIYILYKSKHYKLPKKQRSIKIKDDMVTNNKNVVKNIVLSST